MDRSVREYATYREIKNQGRALTQILARLSGSPSPVKEVDQYLFTGCGSSYFLSQLIAFSWSRRRNTGVLAVPASELILHSEAYRKTGCRIQLFSFSRSGSTSETVLATRQVALDPASTTVAVTCQPDSDLQRLAETCLVFPELAEKGVVMTQAFTGILGAFLAWSGLAEEARLAAWTIKTSIEENERRVETLARQEFKNLIFLGTGPFFPLARESMLKVKEMTALPTEAWQSFEFRHGFKAVVSSGTLVWLYLNHRDYPYLDPLIEDLLAQDATLCLVGSQIPEPLKERAHFFFELNCPADVSEVQALASLHLAQLYAFFKAVSLKRNPDAPPNLSRVVMLS